jgi:hypothetical protein
MGMSRNDRTEQDNLGKGRNKRIKDVDEIMKEVLLGRSD